MEFEYIGSIIFRMKITQLFLPSLVQICWIVSVKIFKIIHVFYFRIW
jgi:hypothetical protein